MSSLMAVGAVAGTGALSWLVEQGGTLLILGALKNWTGASTLLQVFDILAAWAHSSGWVGMAACAGALTVLQLAPVCNGILAGMAVGLMFGTVNGLAVMSFSATASAVACLLLARTVGRSVLGDGERAAAATPELFRAVADGIAGSSFGPAYTRSSIADAFLHASALARAADSGAQAAEFAAPTM